MTDSKTNPSIHTSVEAKMRLKKRYKSERMFKIWGQLAIFVSVAFLLLLLSTIAYKGLPAFTHNFVSLPYDMSEIETLDVSELKKVDYDGLVKTSIRAQFPDVSGRKNKKLLGGILSSGAPVILRKQVIENPNNRNEPLSYEVPISDFADIYLKGHITDETSYEKSDIAQIILNDDEIKVSFASQNFTLIIEQIKSRLINDAQKLREQQAGLILSRDKMQTDISVIDERVKTEDSLIVERLNKEREHLQKNLKKVLAQITKLDKKAKGFERQALATGTQEQPLTNKDKSALLYLNEAVVKITAVQNNYVVGKILMPFSGVAPKQLNDWRLRVLDTPEANRKFLDQEIVWTDELVAKGYVAKKLNWIFATRGASREPEMAGIWGAVVGSFFTIIVTLALAFPLGVAAAIYLEEFAPKNRITTIIEVNINNLAAVPSIVFGLLGLAVFLNFFGLDRSAPYVGGMVLALMTLPTIIIASRAALRAVPPSIREAALGIGASKLQTVLHHVLPLAMPGIMTGTIIGLAQALGETAPLLMIGMVAFVVDIPGSLSDPATVLPVQIFMWADFPEPAFEQRTSAAILVLLAFLILMNALAVIIRKRFERRW